MKTTRIIVASLLALSFMGCGENIQATFSGTANVDLNTCPNGGIGAYNIRVNAQRSGDMNLTVISMTKSGSAGSDGTERYFTTDVKINAPFVGGGNQFNAVNLRIYQDSEVDSVTSSGSIDVDFREISGLEIARTVSQNSGACLVRMRANLLKREE